MEKKYIEKNIELRVRLKGHTDTLTDARRRQTFIRKRAKAAEITEAEVVRRALDYYIHICESTSK